MSKSSLEKMRSCLLLNSSDNLSFFSDSWAKRLVSKNGGLPECFVCKKILNVGEIIVTHMQGGLVSYVGYYHTKCWFERFR